MCGRVHRETSEGWRDAEWGPAKGCEWGGGMRMGELGVQAYVCTERARWAPSARVLCNKTLQFAMCSPTSRFSAFPPAATASFRRGKRDKLERRAISHLAALPAAECCGANGKTSMLFVSSKCRGARGRTADIEGRCAYCRRQQRHRHPACDLYCAIVCCLDCTCFCLPHRTQTGKPRPHTCTWTMVLTWI